MISVKASMEGYFIEVLSNNEFTKAKKMATTRTANGREFYKLLNIPRYVIQGVKVDLGDLVITPSKSREIESVDRLNWLREHGVVFNVATNSFFRIGQIRSQEISYDNIGATCYGMPQLLSTSSGKVVIGAVGTLNNNNLFSGVFEFESS